MDERDGWRVVESDDPANYRYRDGRLEGINDDPVRALRPRKRAARAQPRFVIDNSREEMRQKRFREVKRRTEASLNGFRSSHWTSVAQAPASVHTRSLEVCLRSCLPALRIDLVGA